MGVLEDVEFVEDEGAEVVVDVLAGEGLEVGVEGDLDLLFGVLGVAVEGVGA